MSLSPQHITQIFQRLDQMHQSSRTPIEEHERQFNRVASPLYQYPQYQAQLIQLYIKSLANNELKRPLLNRLPMMTTLANVQNETRQLLRKFASIDAFRELYLLKQSPNTPIAQHNYQIEKRLALLEVPMEDDLLQDLYRKSLRKDVRARLANVQFRCFADLKRAATQISP